MGMTELDVLFTNPSQPGILGYPSVFEAFFQYDNEEPVYVYLGNNLRTQLRVLLL